MDAPVARPGRGLVAASASLRLAMDSFLDQHAGLGLVRHEVVAAARFDRFQQRLAQSCSWARQRADRAALLRRASGGTKRARSEAQTALSLDALCPLALVTLAKSDPSHLARETADAEDARLRAGGRPPATPAPPVDGRAMAQKRFWLAFAVMEAEAALLKARTQAAALCDAAKAHSAPPHLTQWANDCVRALCKAGDDRPLTHSLWGHRAALARRMALSERPPANPSGGYSAVCLGPQQASDVLTTQVGHPHARAPGADDLSRPPQRAALPTVVVVPPAALAAAAERAAAALTAWSAAVSGVTASLTSGRPSTAGRRSSRAAVPVLLRVPGYSGGDIVLLSACDAKGPLAPVPAAVQAGFDVRTSTGEQAPLWRPPSPPVWRQAPRSRAPQTAAAGSVAGPAGVWETSSDGLLPPPPTERDILWTAGARPSDMPALGAPAPPPAPPSQPAAPASPASSAAPAQGQVPEPASGLKPAPSSFARLRTYSDEVRNNEECGMPLLPAAATQSRPASGNPIASSDAFSGAAAPVPVADGADASAAAPHDRAPADISATGDQPRPQKRQLDPDSGACAAEPLAKRRV